jgi:hypothetical protein
VGETVKILAIAEKGGRMGLAVIGDGPMKHLSVKTAADVVSQAMGHWLAICKQEASVLTTINGKQKPPVDAVVFVEGSGFVLGVWVGVVASAGCPTYGMRVQMSKAQIQQAKADVKQKDMDDATVLAIVAGQTFQQTAALGVAQMGGDA